MQALRSAGIEPDEQLVNLASAKRLSGEVALRLAAETSDSAAANNLGLLLQAQGSAEPGTGLRREDDPVPTEDTAATAESATRGSRKGGTQRTSRRTRPRLADVEMLTFSETGDPVVEERLSRLRRLRPDELMLIESHAEAHGGYSIDSGAADVIAKKVGVDSYFDVVKLYSTATGLSSGEPDTDQ